MVAPASSALSPSAQAPTARGPRRAVNATAEPLPAAALPPGGPKRAMFSAALRPVLSPPAGAQPRTPSTVPALGWPRNAILATACATSVAAWQQHRATTCALGAAVLVAGTLERSIPLRGAVGIGALAAGAAATQALPEGTQAKALGLWLTTAALAAYSLHLVPGFTRRIWAQPLHIRPDARPYVPSYNLDKALAASAVLAFCDLPRATASGWGAHVAGVSRAMLPSASVIAVMLLPAVATGTVRFDPAVHPSAWLWAIDNLLLVTVPEETLYRGILPAALAQALPQALSAPWVNLACCSVLFGAAHHKDGVAFASLACVAGVGYGLAARQAGGLIGSVTAHIALNMVHFLCFSYPSLA